MCKFVKPVIPAEATAEDRRSIMFDALCSLDLSDKCKDYNDLTYLPWSAAWEEFKFAYPSATYEIKKNPNTGLPYFSDPNLGIIVFTEVTVDGVTHEMWLPVMNASNRALKEAPYKYQQWSKAKKEFDEYTVQAATMFDVNKTIMRCLVKNLAMFGLGLYIYKGEDIPQSGDDNSNEPKPETKKTAVAPPKPYDRFATIKEQINNSADINALLSLYLDHQAEIEANPNVKAMFTQRKQQLQLLNPQKQ